MKTIEEKAKAYDKIIAKANKMYNENIDVCKACIEELIPELAESEDERIRKELIYYFKENNAALAFRGISNECILAWLAKQGKQKSTIYHKFRPGDTIRHIKQGFTCKIVGVDTEYHLSECNGTHLPFECEDYYELVEQKPSWSEDTLSEFKSKLCELFQRFRFYKDTPTNGDILEYVDEHVQELLEISNNQKAVQWSEEDEINLQWLETICERLHYKSDPQVAPDAALNLKEWLKFLRPQKQQEWSKEDIDMIDWLIRCCEKEHEELCNDRYGHQEIVSDLKRDCRKKWDWLESLKEKVAPQKQWKPNEEQLKQLSKYCIDNRILTELYEQLKVL